ncbi:MAG: hypothetical protein KDC35_18980 [Acidobacteria bacterium]|nr:hypothetical protein [Acidobacteriota bacterium]
MVVYGVFCLILATGAADWRVPKRSIYDGEFAGQTNQDRAVRFVVDHDRLVSLSIEARLSAEGCEKTVSLVIAPNRVVVGNHFDITTSAYRVAGTFNTPSTCSGSWLISDSQLPCPFSASGTWTAVRDPASTIPNITVTPKSFGSFAEIAMSWPSPSPRTRFICFDGTFFWLADSVNDQIFQLNRLGEVVQSFAPPSLNLSGLATNGQVIWTADFQQDQIYELNRKGQVLRQVNAPSGTPVALAWDGQMLWIADNLEKTLFMLDRGLNLQAQMALDDGVIGLGFDGQYMWTYEPVEKLVRRMDSLTGINQDYSYSDSSWPADFASDGQYLYFLDVANANGNTNSINAIPLPRSFQVGQVYNNQFQILSSGSSALQIGTITAVGAASSFQLTDLCSNQLLQPGDACALELQFSPMVEGQHNLSIHIPSNDPATAVTELDLNAWVGPTKVRETTLIYPWISNNTQFESIVVVVNYGTEDTTATLTAQRRSGPAENVTRLIPARGFLRETAASLFSGLGSGAGYSVLVQTASSDVDGVWVSNNLAAASGRSPSQGVAIRIPPYPNAANERLGYDVIFSYLPTSLGLTSAPVIINTANEPVDIRMRFFAQNGSLLLDDQQTLAQLDPLRPFASVANDLVQGDGSMLIATTDSPFVTGVGFTFNLFAEPAIGNVSRMERSFSKHKQNARLVYPWISYNSQFESIVVVNNLDESSQTISLTARRADGQTAQASREIPALGFMAESVETLFPEIGSGPGFAVEVTANSAHIAGSWITNNLETASKRSPAQGVAVDMNNPCESRCGSDILFGFLPLTDGLTSAPVIVHAATVPVDVVLRFFDQSGTCVATKTINGLEPLRPFASVANQLVAEGVGDVYLVASTSGAPITGVGFVFNAGSEPAIGNATSISFKPP